MYLLSFVIALMAVFASLSFSLVEQTRSIIPFTKEVLKRKQHLLTYQQLLQAEQCYRENKGKRAENLAKEGKSKERSEARAFLPLHLLAGTPEQSEQIKFLLLRWIETQLRSEEFLPLEKKEHIYEQFVEELQKQLQRLQEQKELNRESISEITFAQEEYNKLFYYLWEGVEIEKGLVLPLKEFITLQGEGKIRLWLAPKAVLSLLFDQEKVEQIASLRKELYRKLKQGALDQSSCFESFSEAFNPSSVSTAVERMLDFSCSLSNPDMYEPKSL